MSAEFSGPDMGYVGFEDPYDTLSGNNMPPAPNLSDSPHRPVVDPTTTATSRDELMTLPPAAIQDLDDMYFQLDARLNGIGIYTESIQTAKNHIFYTVGSQYAEERIKGKPLPETDRVRYTLASALLAGLYIGQGSQAGPNDAINILNTRTFNRDHALFTASEQKFLWGRVQMLVGELQHTASLPDVAERADYAFQQAITEAERQGSHPLVLLTLQALQVGATIEKPELTTKHFADFLANLPRTS